jgi:hypothetical protein
MKIKKASYHSISFLALVFVFLVMPKLIFAANEINIPETNLPSPPGGIQAILSNLLAWILGIIGMIAIISFAIAGFQYFYSAGDQTKMETAKKNLTYSIIGVVVALSGLVILKAIDTALRGMGTI